MTLWDKGSRGSDAGDHAAMHPSCRDGAVLILDLGTNAIRIIPARCKQWHCPRCGPRLRDLWAQRIADARPKRFITLTCQHGRFVSPRHAYLAMKRALPKLIALIRRKIGPLEYCAVWELHLSGWPHLHLAALGSYVPKAFISACWDRLGLGPNTDIRSIHTRRGAARYVSKYITKTAADGKDALGITKLIQASRGFFPKSKTFVAKSVNTEVDTVYSRDHLGQILDRLILTYGYVWVRDESASSYVLAVGPDTKPLANLDEFALYTPP